MYGSNTSPEDFHRGVNAAIQAYQKCYSTRGNRSCAFDRELFLRFEKVSQKKCSPCDGYPHKRRLLVHPNFPQDLGLLLEPNKFTFLNVNHDVIFQVDPHTQPRQHDKT